MASTYLTRTISSGGNRQKMTFSAWIKRAVTSTSTMVFATGTGSERDMIHLESSGKLQFSRYNNAYNYHLKTNRLFRDTSAWYHIVCVLDTTQATSTDRAKIYINGVQETSLDTASYPSQNYNTNYNQNTFTQSLGRDTDGNFPFDGSMSHVHYIDGTAYDASAFGSSDSNGVWTPNTSPSVTYGTNGFFLKFEDTSAMGDDSSGNSNDFSVGAGTLTKTKDTPSNVFATLNPLTTSTTSGSFSNGNTTHAKSNSTWASTTSTLAASSGKYYAEYKFTVNSSSSNGQMAAIVNMDLTNYMNENSDLEQNGNKGITYYANGTVFADNQQTVATYGSYTNNIIQIAMDLDNGFLYFGKDGVWQNSANPASGATGTGGINISNYLGTGTFAFGLANRNTGSTSVNFGNGYFGTTAVTSAGTNASGNGIFEYDVPTGYTALSTKGLDS